MNLPTLPKDFLARFSFQSFFKIKPLKNVLNLQCSWLFKAENPVSDTIIEQTAVVLSSSCYQSREKFLADIAGVFTL